RLAGGVVGRGTAVSSRAQGDAGIIVEAVRLALEEGTGRMPIERDALFEESLREMAPSVTISLELAGPLVPITVREYADVSLEIAAGAEGVGVRIGDRIDVLFPGTMLSNQTEPGSGLSAVVSRLTDDARLGL